MTSPNPFCEITPELLHLANLSETCAVIDPDLYNQYDVKVYWLVLPIFRMYAPQKS